MNSVLQYVLYVGILVAFSIPLGFYIRVSRKSIICHQNKLITKEIVDYCEIIVSNTAKM